MGWLPPAYGCNSWVAIRHEFYDITGWKVGWCEGYCLFYLYFWIFRGQRGGRRFSYLPVRGGFCSWVGRGMFQAFLERCVVTVDPYFGNDHPWKQLEWYQGGSLAIRGRLVSRLLISVGGSWGVLISHCIVWWLLAKQKLQNGALLIDVSYIEG